MSRRATCEERQFGTGSGTKQEQAAVRRPSGAMLLCSSALTSRIFKLEGQTGADTKYMVLRSALSSSNGKTVRVKVCLGLAHCQHVAYDRVP